MTVLFVGQNPTSHQAADTAFEGTQSGKRLDAWIAYLGIKSVVLINAATKTGRVTLADADRVHVLSAILKYTPDKVIALGSYASRVLKTCSVDHFCLPHPSGRNRKLNDKMWVNAQLSLCKAWLSDVKGIASSPSIQVS